ncbi:MAG TPA: SOS response-associated peptidase [Acidimicrobiales bacterium]|nr:SOS response-associated peptidase [Acidimicrobiales bacterium]
MCGRFVSTSDPALLADLLHVDEVRTEALDPSWNVAPTDSVYAAAERGPHDDEPARRMLGTYRWGLVPSWAKDPSIGSRMINARAETVDKKFGRALERRRCLIPADGFYEWERRSDGAKQPWFIHRADGAPMVFAGLWEVWFDPGAGDGAEPLRTCTILTTEANDLVRPLHDRMPVVLSPADWDLWLDRAVTDPVALRGLLQPADARSLEMFEVSTRVNNVRNNDDHLVLPLNSK